MNAATFQQPETEFDRKPVGEGTGRAWYGRVPRSERRGEARAQLQRRGRNKANRAVIFADRSLITIRVIRTDHEVMIARAVCCLLGFLTKKQI